MTRVVATCLLAAVSACSYDWTVAPAPDGGVDASLGPDAGLDAAADAADAGDAANVDCNALARQAEAEKAAAKACELPGSTACTNPIQDECGCDQIVGNKDANAVNTYAATLARFRNAGCPKPAACPAQCPSANKGLCVVDNPDAGTLKCSQ